MPWSHTWGLCIQDCFRPWWLGPCPGSPEPSTLCGLSPSKLSKSPSSAWDQPGLAGVLRWGPPSLKGELHRPWSLFVLSRHSPTLSPVCGAHASKSSEDSG